MADLPDERAAWDPPGLLDRKYTETEIAFEFGDLFDQDKAFEGYADDGDMVQPFRFLDLWYLVKKDGDNKRLALPTNCSFQGGDYENCVVKGWLKPASSGLQEPISIELTAMEYFSVDRSKRYRGYWLHTRSALYWLQQPNKTKPGPGMRSQVQVHLAARAQLDVLSNVIDNVLWVADAAQWATKTVVQAHKEIAAMTGKEPFNKLLLTKYKTFVVQHLIDAMSLQPFHPAFTHKSAFVKSLKATKSKTTFRDAELLELTLQAEVISHQTPWGEWLTGFIVTDDYLGSIEAVLLDHVQLDDEVEHALESITVPDNNPNSATRAIKLNVDAAPLSTKSKLQGPSYSSDDEDSHLSDSDDEAYEKRPSKRKLKKTTTKNNPVKKPKVVVKKATRKKRASSETTTTSTVTLPNGKKAKAEVDSDLWSPARNREALISLRNYMEPLPEKHILYASWEEVQDQGFCIPDGERAKALMLDIGNWETHLQSLECLLLVSEAFHNTCVFKRTDATKKFLAFKKCQIAIIVFDSWRRRAAALLQERLDTKKSVQNTPELFLLVSILGLIADCNTVKTPTTLENLKRRGLDWDHSVDEVCLLCEKLQNHNLTKALDRTKKKLECIHTNVKSPESAGVTASTVQIEAKPQVQTSFKNLVAKVSSSGHAIPSPALTVPKKATQASEKGHGTFLEAEEALAEERRKRVLAAVAVPAPSATTETTSRSWGSKPFIQGDVASEGDQVSRSSWWSQSSGVATHRNWGSAAKTDSSTSWGSKKVNTPSTTSWGSKKVDAASTTSWGSKKVDAASTTPWGSKKVDADLTTAWGSMKVDAASTTPWGSKKVDAASTTSWGSMKVDAASTTPWGSLKVDAASTTAWGSKKTEIPSATSWGSKRADAPSTTSWGSKKTDIPSATPWGSRKTGTELKGDGSKLKSGDRSFSSNRAQSTGVTDGCRGLASGMTLKEEAAASSSPSGESCSWTSAKMAIPEESGATVMLKAASRAPDLSKSAYSEPPSSQISAALINQQSAPDLGNGRGRNLTLPAWMTKNGANQAGPTKTGDRKAPVELSAYSSRSAVSAPSQSTLGYGRGKRVNLPAWMTQNDSCKTDDSRLHSEPPERDGRSSHASRSRERDSRSSSRSGSNESKMRGSDSQSSRRSKSPESKPRARERSSRRSRSPGNGSYERDNRSSQRSRSPDPYARGSRSSQARDRHPSSHSRSGGREPGDTRYPLTHHSLSTTPSQGQPARGTGRDKNLPAWMTRGTNGPMAGRSEPRTADNSRGPPVRPNDQSRVAVVSSYSALGTAPPKDASTTRERVRPDYRG